jgi:iron complex outermembrane recepter protein
MRSIELNAAGLRARPARRFAASAKPLLLLSLTATQSVLAQTADPAQRAPGQVLERVEVTGSRILRDGYEAPTPLTVIGVEEMTATAPSNVADFVNQLPSVAGSQTPGNSQRSVSNGSAGVNSLNLRALGSERTLVLLDGQRSVGATLNGVVDVNDFPQQLIERIDIVTGGASAAYGSDALSGVVNFVLDKDFTGFRTDLTGGITGEGDNEEYTAAATFGTPFATDRGHFLLSAQLNHIDGIFGVPRDWDKKGWKIMNNPAYTPTNGEPERLLRPQVGLSSATLGGIVTAGPLRGTAFGPGGVPYQFQYGPLVRDPFMQGGDWRDSDVSSFNSLASGIDRKNVFTRASFELTDDVEVFAQFSWGNTEADSWCCRQFNVANLTVQPDNAFIPESVREQMVALGVADQPLRLGSMHADLPVISTVNERTVSRYVLGGNGRFDAFGSDWHWDAYAQKGISKVLSTAPNVTIKSKFAEATDAVLDASGNIVCRSTLTDPDNGCVPYNLMGIGVNSQDALDYVLGDARRNERFTQDVAAASLQGEPFDSWAGPVSVAVGAEYRREAVTGSADPLSLVNGFFAGNYLPTKGSYHVAEGFFETVVPLAEHLPWADKLDFNGAVRYTDYSTSGQVITWKAGAVYSPIPDLTFRATRSRDIRAPNLLELFQAGGANTNNVIDPFNNNANIAYQGLAVGNLELDPEKADTTGFGVVYQPSWAPGFSASVDYYDIDIKDAIGTISAQEIVDRCFAGNQTFCAAITRDPVAGVITQIRTSPFNLITQVARGFDIEASYRLPAPLWGGELAIRALATHYLKNYSANGINVPTDTAGTNAAGGPPSWLGRMSVTYSNDPLTAMLIARGVSSGVYDNAFIECTSGCPASTPDHRTIDDNHIDGAVYFDASLSYQLRAASVFSETELFVAVTNLADKDPVVVAPGPGGVAYATSANNPSLYDSLGRVFRAGVRLKL